MRPTKNSEIASDVTSPVTLRQVTIQEDHQPTRGSSTPSSQNTPREEDNGERHNAAFVNDETMHTSFNNGYHHPSSAPIDDINDLDTSQGDTYTGNGLDTSFTNYAKLSPTHNAVRSRHKSEGQNSQFSDDVDGNGRAKSDYSSIIKFDEERFEDDNEGLSLCYSKHEKVPLKDFSNEVRASRDVENYLRNMVLILNLHKTNVDDIIDICLNKVLEKNPHTQSYDQAKSAIFTHDSVHQLSRTIRSTTLSEGGGFAYDQNWIGVMCTVPSLTSRQVCIARLLQPANFGTNSQEVQFIVIILAPVKEKGTKSELEVARTFGTIFANTEIRQELLSAHNEEDFKEIFKQVAHTLAVIHSHKDEDHLEEDIKAPKMKCGFMKGIYGDLKRRIPHYWSDYKDGVADKKSIAKTLSCTFFLYFACILPSIAFGVLNSSNTGGILTVEKVLYSQVFGGLVFAIFGGTPQIVLLTTAPLALYTNIIFTMSDQFDLDFQGFFGLVGIFNCMFLVIFSVFDLSILMQFSTRSSEEIFALFISIAFSVDAFKNCAKNFNSHYCDPSDIVNDNMSLPITNSSAIAEDSCAREISLLYLLLLLGTLWFGVTLFRFKETPYLTAGKREIMADYALPVSVIVMTFVGAFLFKDVNMKKSFETSSEDIGSIFKIVDLKSLPWEAVLGACGLGFCLSLLFFMDQNISAALVNAPQNKMQKGTAYHWDLLVIAIINAVLSLLGLPWVHAALPHSPLHVHALADMEERVEQGHIYQIVVKVRETRLTCVFSHILIGVSLTFLSVLAYIPAPVLYGLFLYVAVTALYGNQMFERIQLFFTEQAAYPPNHFIRRVPQRKMHAFTGLQLLQLAILCGVGFAPYPYLKMFFPVLIFCLIPIRHKVIPKLVEQKYLKALDGH